MNLYLQFIYHKTSKNIFYYMELLTISQLSTQMAEQLRFWRLPDTGFTIFRNKTNIYLFLKLLHNWF